MSDITIDELRQKIEETGLLNKKAFFVHSELEKDMKSFRKYLQQHLEYVLELEESGKLILAGPTWEANSDVHDGQGIFILRASSLREAKEIADNDPMVKHGVRSYTIQPFLICEGQLQLRINLSDSSMEFD